MQLPAALLLDRTTRLMTQEEYAKHLGVSLSLVWLLENGRQAPSMKTAKKLLAAGVSRAAVMEAVTAKAKASAA